MMYCFLPSPVSLKLFASTSERESGIWSLKVIISSSESETYVFRSMTVSPVRGRERLLFWHLPRASMKPTSQGERGREEIS